MAQVADELAFERVQVTDMKFLELRQQITDASELVL